MSNVTGIILGIVGAVVGFVVTGYNPMGAVMGFSLGMMVGQIIDPMVPDVPQPGQPQLADLDITSCKEGDPLPDFFGTTKITGNIVQTWGNRTVTLTQTQEVGGKGGGGQSQTVVTGYEYHLSWVQAFSYGKDPVDKLLTVLFDDVCVYSGELTDDDSDGEETITLGEFGGDILGSMTFYFGTSNQVANAKAAAALDDPTLASGLRGLCYAVFDDINIGSINRCPTVRIVVSKYPSIAAIGSDSLALCNCLDYNPAFALWYIMEKHSEMDSARLDDVSFAAAAAAFQSEDYVGVSLLLSKQVPAMTYVEGILNHVGSIMIETDGQLVLKRLRDDIAIANMPAITDDNVLSEPMLKVGSWLNTFNDIKIQYSYMDCTTYPFLGNVQKISSFEWNSYQGSWSAVFRVEEGENLWLGTKPRTDDQWLFRMSDDGYLVEYDTDHWSWDAAYDINYYGGGLKVGDRVFAYGYAEYPSSGQFSVTTIKVNDNDTLEPYTPVDTVAYVTYCNASYARNGMVEVAPGYYAICWQQWSGSAHVALQVIDSLGNINATKVDDVTYTGGGVSSYNIICMLPGYSSIYVVMKGGTTTNLFTTFNITTGGITQLHQESLANGFSAQYSSCMLASGIPAGFQGIIYTSTRGSSPYDTWIYSATIDGVGNIVQVDAVELVNPSINAGGCDIKYLSGNRFMVANRNWVLFVTVDSSGNLEVLTDLTFNTGYIKYAPQLINIKDNIWAVNGASSNKGRITTFSVQ